VAIGIGETLVASGHEPRVCLENGGIATSSTTTRTWRIGSQLATTLSTRAPVPSPPASTRSRPSAPRVVSAQRLRHGGAAVGKRCGYTSRKRDGRPGSCNTARSGVVGGCPRRWALVIALTSPYLWYTTRATGIVTLVLFTLVVALGTLVSTHWRHLVGRFELNELHRSIRLSRWFFFSSTCSPPSSTATSRRHHLGRGADDVTVQTSRRRPGAISFDLMVAVLVSSVMKSRIENRSWRLSTVQLAGLYRVHRARLPDRHRHERRRRISTGDRVFVSRHRCGLWRYAARPTRASGRTALSPWRRAIRLAERPNDASIPESAARAGAAGPKMIDANVLPRVLHGSSRRPCHWSSTRRHCAARTSDVALGRARSLGPHGTRWCSVPTARKVRLLREQHGRRKWVVVNAMEGEPASHKEYRCCRRTPSGARRSRILASMIGAERIDVCVARDNPRRSTTSPGHPRARTQRQARSADRVAHAAGALRSPEKSRRSSTGSTTMSPCPNIARTDLRS